MTIWQFTIQNREVQHGSRKRKLLTPKGCNEPFKDRFWCPKQKWFSKEPCPFINRRECENFSIMSGEHFAQKQEIKLPPHQCTEPGQVPKIKSVELN